MYQIPELAKIPGLFHAFSRVEDGNMSFNWGGKEEVIANREKFLNGLGIQMEECVALQLEGKDGIAIANRSDSGAGMRRGEESLVGDAVLTGESGLYLFLLIGDCIPVVVYDPEKRAVGVVHAGWRGVELNILNKTVEVFKSRFGTNPSKLFAGIGPAIKKESYRFNLEDTEEKKKEVHARKWKPYLENCTDGRISIDIIGYATNQLIEAGVENGKIFVSDIDTCADRNFFSHRRDAVEGKRDQGRFACIAGIQKTKY